MDELTIKELWTKISSSTVDEAQAPYTKFEGYHKLTGEGQVLMLWDASGTPVETLQGTGFILFDTTVFYAEGGGQPSDQGVLHPKNNNGLIQVWDLNKKIWDHRYLHLVDTGVLSVGVGEQLQQVVEPNRRRILTCNHSGQHLFSDAMNLVAGKVLEEHSIGIKLDYFASEFYQDPFFTVENILKARDLTREWMAKSIPSREVYMDLDEARAKNLITREYNYSDYVRVVEFENTCADLCGGTHIDNTDQLPCLEVLEISISKKYASMKVTTNLEALHNFMQSNYVKLQEEAQRSYSKIKNCNQQPDFDVTKLTVPTSYETLVALQNQVKEYTQQAQQIEKEFKKAMQETIRTMQFASRTMALKDLEWIDLTTELANVELGMFRGRLVQEIAHYANGVICFQNTTIPQRAMLLGNVALGSAIDFRQLFNNYPDKDKLSGGGSTLCFEVAAPDAPTLNAFIDFIKSSI